MPQEKDLVIHFEDNRNIGAAGVHEPSDNLPTELAGDPRVEKRILRKIDIRLVPILCSIYAICLIDRGNISVAQISGIGKDTGLNIGNRTSITLLVFFIGYIIFEIPSNIFIRKVGPSNWLPFICFAWGIVSLGIGFCDNWIAVAVCRSILGVLEAGLSPGAIYLISSWYKRYEVQKRLGSWVMAGSAISAFANILAYGIIQIANTTSYKGWRWIYIIEGCLTCLIAVIARIVLIDFPGSPRNKFLSAEEKAIVKARLQEDRGDGEREKVTLAAIGKTMLDWQVWSYAFMYMAGAIGVYAFLFFLPLILQNGLGYSQELSFILSAPPSLFAVVFALAVSWLADEFRLRGPLLVAQGLFGIVGLCMTAFLSAPTPRYVGTFLGVATGYGLIVTCLAWQTNNIRGDAKRSVASAIQVMASGVGGIYSSLVFRAQDAPQYQPGIIAVIVVYVCTVVVATLTSIMLWRYNKQAERGERINEGLVGFRYTI